MPTLGKLRIKWLIVQIVFYIAFNSNFSHVTATAHIIHVYPEFHKYQVRALKCLAQGHSHEKPTGSNVAQTQDPMIKSKHYTTEPRN